MVVCLCRFCWWCCIHFCCFFRSHYTFLFVCVCLCVFIFVSKQTAVNCLQLPSNSNICSAVGTRIACGQLKYRMKIIQFVWLRMPAWPISVSRTLFSIFSFQWIAHSLPSPCVCVRRDDVPSISSHSPFIMDWLFTLLFTLFRENSFSIFSFFLWMPHFSRLFRVFVCLFFPFIFILALSFFLLFFQI